MSLEKKVREKEEENDMLKTKHEKEKYDKLLKQNKIIINLEEQLRSAKQQERAGTSDLISKHDKEIHEMKAKHATELESVRKTMETQKAEEAARLKEAHMSEINNLNQSREVMISSLNKNFDQQLNNSMRLSKQMHTTEVETVNTRNEELKRAINEMSAELEAKKR